MTTSQPAPEALDSPAPGRVDAPDGDTLARVLDGLRGLDLPEQPSAPGAPGPRDTAGGTPAVPLPRRRSGRTVPPVDRAGRRGDSGR